MRRYLKFFVLPAVFTSFNGMLWGQQSIDNTIFRLTASHRFCVCCFFLGHAKKKQKRAVNPSNTDYTPLIGYRLGESKYIITEKKLGQAGILSQLFGLFTL